MIDVADLAVAYDDVAAVDGVDLTVERGEFVTIVGPSGCGKTSLLRAIGGLVEPAEGRVRIDGREPRVARERADVGFVFQDHALFPWKTALENVTFLRRLAGDETRPDEARTLLAALGLADAADRYPEELSGGMAQRVAIARALHLDASVLLMDEPFGELDELTRDRLGVELRELWRRERKTILFVTHSVPEAVLLADRCLLVDGPPGRIVETFAIELPRPRDERSFESEAYQDHVADVRGALREIRSAPDGRSNPPAGIGSTPRDG